MIHSLSGGTAKEYNVYDYAKVDVLGRVMFFISPFSELKAGDKVEVSVGTKNEIGVVLRVDKNVTEQNFPIPAKRMKYIIRIVN